MTDETETKVSNFLDRAAFHDGRVVALEETDAILQAAMDKFEALGPMPTADGNPFEILAYQVRVAQAAGAVLRDMSDGLQRLVKEGKAQRELLMRDQAVILDGGALH